MRTKTDSPAKTNVWLEALGWYGTAAVVGAYALVSFNALDNTSVLFQVLNLTGSIGLIAISWHKRASQPAVLNVIWASIALVALIRLAL